METNKIIIYTDGGSRGNPGPAALGAVIQFPEDHGKLFSAGEHKKYGETIGVATNNVAEYSAVIFALKKARVLLGKARAKKTSIELRTDSELLVKQMNGEYKVKNKDLRELFVEVWDLKQDFRKVSFVHVFREKNKEADEMVNKALDGEL